MNFSTTIRMTTLATTLGLGTALLADDSAAHRDAATTTASQTLDVPQRQAIAAGVKKNKPIVTLACHRSFLSAHTAMHYAPPASYYAPPMPARPQYAPAAQPASLPAATPSAAPAPAASRVAAVPAATAVPAEAAPPAPAAMARNVEVLLTNGEQETVAYSLNGTRYDMPADHGQKLTTRPSWVVEFDRGGEFGTARYTLKQGTYMFVASERGWDLVKKDDTPAPPSTRLGFANR